MEETNSGRLLTQPGDIPPSVTGYSFCHYSTISALILLPHFDLVLKIPLSVYFAPSLPIQRDSAVFPLLHYFGINHIPSMCGDTTIDSFENPGLKPLKPPGFIVGTQACHHYLTYLASTTCLPRPTLPRETDITPATQLGLLSTSPGGWTSLGAVRLTGSAGFSPLSSTSQMG